MFFCDTHIVYMDTTLYIYMYINERLKYNEYFTNLICFNSIILFE